MSETKKELLTKADAIEKEIRSAGTNIIGANVLKRHTDTLDNFQRLHIAKEIKNGRSLEDLITHL